MNLENWYIRGSVGDGDNYLLHYASKGKLQFIYPLEEHRDGSFNHHGWFYSYGDDRIAKYKNTVDLIFVKDHAGPSMTKMKMFGVNFNAEQLKELIKNAEDCLKQLKLNSFNCS